MTRIIRWEPVREFPGLQDRLHRMSHLFRDASNSEGPEEALTTTNFAPPVDIYEDEHNITVKMEVPGIDDKISMSASRATAGRARRAQV